MAPDLRPGPDSPPTDELDGAEAALRVMQQVLHPIAADDMPRPTPCAQFDVTRLTDHLLKSLGRWAAWPAPISRTMRTARTRWNAG